jgi:CheY-like chemotaxis protein
MASGPSLLLVDDNPAYVRLTSLLAEDALGRDVDVRSAGSVGEAVAALAERSADVVLLDLGLPDGGGTTGIERIKAAGAKHVIVLSGRSDNGIDGRARAAGADAYIVKGTEVARLPEVLAATLAG